jgi:hypothetical protein
MPERVPADVRAEFGFQRCGFDVPNTDTILPVRSLGAGCGEVAETAVSSLINDIALLGWGPSARHYSFPVASTTASRKAARKKNSPVT